MMGMAVRVVGIDVSALRIDTLHRARATSSYSPSSSSAAAAAEWQNFSSESAEAVVRGLRSERLFFEPRSSTRSILEEVVPCTGFVAATMESEDPCEDFRVSMEEMVMAYGVKDYVWLEEMLNWYLMLNGKEMHGLIVGAFLDLLVLLADSRCPVSCSHSSSSGIFSDEGNGR